MFAHGLEDVRIITIDTTGAPVLLHPDETDYSGGIKVLGAVGIRRVECPTLNGLVRYDITQVLPMTSLTAELECALLRDYEVSRASSPEWLASLYALA